MFASSGEITPPCGVPASVSRHPSVFHHPRFQPLPHSLSTRRSLTRFDTIFHQAFLIDAVEEALDVRVDDVVVAAIAQPLDDFERLRRAALRAEAVRTRAGSPPRRSAPSPASSPSALRGLAPSGFPVAAASRPAFGMYRRRTGCGRYSPARSAACDFVREILRRPCCSIVRDGLTVDAGGAPVSLNSSPRFPQDVTPADPVVQRMETPCPASAWPPVEPALELSHFSFGVVGRYSRHALALTSIRTRDRSRAPSLRPRCLAAIAGTTSPSDSLSAASRFHALRLSACTSL